ncbi:hypothetical protein DEIPH_ctg031orf0056 [Deinococcus phoenicis]|uniref:Uncharacterized protein n=1 Tax=Deinococcus phoenicis TaxID=1476583 RepID=A0A016QPT6_9DEIO|nr:hypothetical protein [Deinococcus phoenicis]EYB67912.1 hypothetical protein DEIPH_ctg031orf0056 [Deinococcus phoenicis]
MLPAASASPPTSSSPLAEDLANSALARPLDFCVPSNRFVVVGAVASVLAARLSGRAWGAALGVGAAGFLGWSTARELDPDHPDTANAALPLAALTALLGGSPDLPAGLGVLSGLRTLAATVGKPPSALDVAALAGQAALSAWAGARVAALVPGAALALSAQRADSWQASWQAAGLAGAAALLPGSRRGEGRSVPADLLALAGLGLAGVLAAPEGVHSRLDRAPARVSAERVRLARLLALGTLGAGCWPGRRGPSRRWPPPC